MIQDELRALYDQMSDEEKNENSVLKGRFTKYITRRLEWHAIRYAVHKGKSIVTILLDNILDCAYRKGFKVPLKFPVQASVPPLSGVFQQCIARRTKRLAPCPMHATTIPANHEGNGFDLLFLV